MKKTCLFLAALLFSLSLVQPSSARPQSPSAPQQAPPTISYPSYSQTTSAQPTSPRKITAYTLPPESYKKSQDLSRIFLRFRLITFVYGLIVLLLILRWKLAPKYRTLAEAVSSNRFFQAAIFAPLLILTMDLLQLPSGIYANWVLLKYGISVQGWASWFWDWTKGELLSAILGIVLVWILYAVIRKSQRRWWFYFWVVSLPIGLAIFFVQPLVIDPLFHKFEPLASKDPALTEALEKLVQHSGESIPRERMFWMGAGEKTTDLNAYVAGFGASKRIVVWDTTIAKMDTPQIVYVTGHEMGHYVLNHIPKGLAFFAALLFVSFYVGYRTIGWSLASKGQSWEIRGLDDWASLPVLLLILSIFFFVVTPISSTFGRHFEHQADQYGLEVTHSLTPDSGQVAAQAFQILGEVSYDDPDPSSLRIFLFYDHPAIRDRVQYSLTYNPWSHNQPPEFVK